MVTIVELLSRQNTDLVVGMHTLQPEAAHEWVKRAIQNQDIATNKMLIARNSYYSTIGHNNATSLQEPVEVGNHDESGPLQYLGPGLVAPESSPTQIL